MSAFIYANEKRNCFNSLLQHTSSADLPLHPDSDLEQKKKEKRKYSLWCIIQGSQVTLTNVGINIKSLSCKTEEKKKSFITTRKKSFITTPRANLLTRV